MSPAYAEAHDETRRIVEAIPWSRFVRAAPAEVAALLTGGRFSLLRGDVASAELAFREALRVAPGWTAPHTCMAELNMRASNHGTAVEFLRQACSSEPDNHALRSALLSALQLADAHCQDSWRTFPTRPSIPLDVNAAWHEEETTPRFPRTSSLDTVTASSGKAPPLVAEADAPKPRHPLRWLSFVTVAAVLGFVVGAASAGSAGERRMPGAAPAAVASIDPALAVTRALPQPSSRESELATLSLLRRAIASPERATEAARRLSAEASADDDARLLTELLSVLERLGRDPAPGAPASLPAPKGPSEVTDLLSHLLLAWRATDSRTARTHLDAALESSLRHEGPLGAALMLASARGELDQAARAVSTLHEIGADSVALASLASRVLAWGDGITALGLLDARCNDSAGAAALSLQAALLVDDRDKLSRCLTALLEQADDPEAPPARAARAVERQVDAQPDGHLGTFEELANRIREEEAEAPPEPREADALRWRAEVRLGLSHARSAGKARPLQALLADAELAVSARDERGLEHIISMLEQPAQHEMAAIELRGGLAALRGQLDAARAAWGRIIRLQPARLDLRWRTAQSLLAQGLLEEAERELAHVRRLGALAPGSAIYRSAGPRLVSTLIELGDFTQAQRLFAELSPSMTEEQRLPLEIRLATASNPPLALALSRRSRSRAPEVELARADAALAAGWPALAASSFAAALRDCEPHECPRARLGLGEAWLRQGRWLRAHYALDRTIRDLAQAGYSGPLLARALWLDGKALLHTSPAAPRSALTYLQRAVDLGAPAEASFWLGVAHNMAHSPAADQRRVLERFLERSPGHSLAPRARRLLQLIGP